VESGEADQTRTVGKAWLGRKLGALSNEEALV
jgi:hypothetical protein